ncbi:MAG: response regulator transcription factor [Proteobacteria bacterium]|nr:response regulator transcription factor [Pseudomonadota bacterium]
MASEKQPHAVANGGEHGHGTAGVAERAATRVLLIDDHAILREGLSALLELESDLRVVGHAATIPDGLTLARSLQPDLIITDVSLPGATGVQGILELRQNSPRARLVVLTVHATEEYIRAALAAGADGYVLKDASRSELIYGLRTVLSGQRHLCARASARIVRSYLGDAQKPATTVTGVTGREREVLSMIASGLSNKRIAASLNRSVKTVEKHRANLMRKLQLHNVADVTRFAMQSGLLRDDPHAEAAPPQASRSHG